MNEDLLRFAEFYGRTEVRVGVLGVTKIVDADSNIVVHTESGATFTYAWSSIRNFQWA